MIRIKHILIILFIFFTSQRVIGQAFVAENISVVFISNAPLSEFEGKSQKLAGLIDLKNNLLDFYLDLNTLKTGIGLRDKHMRDNYLETKKYPYAEFTGKISGLDDIDLEEFVGERNVIAKGEFSIHGVTQEKEIKGKLQMSEDKQRIILKAEFEVALTDHKIEKPSLVGYDLADVQVVKIQGELIRRKKDD